MSDDAAPTLFHPAPHGLDRAGLALWFSIAEHYELRPDELAVLEDACRTSDTIARLELAWESSGYLTEARGVAGQQVIHPLVGELRMQRSARAALLGKLKLPDLDDAPIVNQNRDAATSSWKPTAARSRNRGA